MNIVKSAENVAVIVGTSIFLSALGYTGMSLFPSGIYKVPVTYPNTPDRLVPEAQEIDRYVFNAKVTEATFDSLSLTLLNIPDYEEIIHAFGSTDTRPSFEMSGNNCADNANTVEISDQVLNTISYDQFITMVSEPNSDVSIEFTYGEWIPTDDCLNYFPQIEITEDRIISISILPN